MDEMAFVSAVPLASSARSASRNGLQLSVRNPATPGPARTASPSSVTMQQVEFQTFSGGLDRINTKPYSITRYLFQPTPPLTSVDDDKDTVVRAALRHLFGNAYLMEEERADFYTYESKYRAGLITAKDFVRGVAMSETYRKRFFESVSQFRFVELNFKHFLGRSPLNQTEYSKHFKIFATGGYEAEINSYFDELEYDQVFGEDTFPFTRFNGTYAPINQFNRMCTMEGGFARSDKNLPAQLSASLAMGVPTTVHSIIDGLPPIPNSQFPSEKYDLPLAGSLEQYKNELAVAKAKALKLQLDVDASYAKLAKYRDGFSMFTDMVKDMDYSVLPGSNFTGIKVENFPSWSGPNSSDPKPWGKSGVDRLGGVVKKPAAAVTVKENELERVKQLVVDLERKVAVLQAQRDNPTFTPEFIPFELEGLPVFVDEPELEAVVIGAPATKTIGVDVDTSQFDASTLLTNDIDPEAEDSQVSAPKEVEIETSRALKDVGKLPKQLMKELEEKTKAEGKEFGGPKDGRLRFPGDGSEMTIG